MSIKKTSITDQDITFLKKAIYKESCLENINLALCIPDVHVLAVGPESCLRVLYFRAMRQRQNDRFCMQTMDSSDLVAGRHLDMAKMALQNMLKDEKNHIKAVIIYISCTDILMNSDFESIIKCIQGEYGMPIKLFKRGPLSKRRILPKERLSNIFAGILDAYTGNDYISEGNNRPIINILGEEKLSEECDLKTLLREQGCYSIQEFLNCKTFEDFKNLANGTYSIVTHKFGMNMAAHLEKRFGIPYCFIPLTYSKDECDTELKTINRIVGDRL
ncbi:nitrogenase component 1 [Desulfitibacter alkalitolerans]|uniref:nitrogenase component 1 n=1 Tax=Desulfitibacter alkalitolerans TaxID=264641 RepID=UPI0004846662|nr:nitrogenase component 1 [Desulfitibacter alkalitolerans]